MTVRSRPNNPVSGSAVTCSNDRASARGMSVFVYDARSEYEFPDDFRGYAIIVWS